MPDFHYAEYCKIGKIPIQGCKVKCKTNKSVRHFHYTEYCNIGKIPMHKQGCKAKWPYLPIGSLSVYAVIGYTKGFRAMPDFRQFSLDSHVLCQNTGRKSN